LQCDAIFTMNVDGTDVKMVSSGKGTTTCSYIAPDYKSIIYASTHMGGDECYHGFWDADPSVQQFMKDNNLKDSHELQSYFVGRIQNIINKKAKKMIGWDEILEGGLAEGASVMSWRGMEGGLPLSR